MYFKGCFIAVSVYRVAMKRVSQTQDAYLGNKILKSRKSFLI